MSTIAQSIKVFYTTIERSTGAETYDITGMLTEAEQKGEATQDWDNEQTEFDFPDGSVLIVGTDYATAYGSR
jgi:hypothetical protein